MKIAIIAITAALAVGTLVAAAVPASAGNCTYRNDLASDGSYCGGRSSYDRPGGLQPLSPYRPRYY